MSKKQKKALLADVDKALHALGRIDDGGHDFSKLRFAAVSTKMLLDSCLMTMAGLAVLRASLLSELGTDNL